MAVDSDAHEPLLIDDILEDDDDYTGNEPDGTHLPHGSGTKQRSANTSSVGRVNALFDEEPIRA
jgi:hypothetical protein